MINVTINLFKSLLAHILATIKFYTFLSTYTMVTIEHGHSLYI